MIYCTTYLMKQFTYGIPKLCFEPSILSVGMSWLGCGHCLDELDRAMGKPCLRRRMLMFSIFSWLMTRWKLLGLHSFHCYLLLQSGLFGPQHACTYMYNIYIYEYIWCFCVFDIITCMSISYLICIYVSFRKTFESQHGLFDVNQPRNPMPNIPTAA